MTQFFRENGYTEARFIPDGRVACIMPLLFTAAIIVINPDRYDWGYEDRWCYHSNAAAVTAINNWTEGPEPQGWHRHPTTGRRRPEGDSTKEYINH